MTSGEQQATAPSDAFKSSPHTLSKLQDVYAIATQSFSDVPENIKIMVLSFFQPLEGLLSSQPSDVVGRLMYSVFRVVAVLESVGALNELTTASSRYIPPHSPATPNCKRGGSMHPGVLLILRDNNFAIFVRDIAKTFVLNCSEDLWTGDLAVIRSDNGKRLHTGLQCIAVFFANRAGFNGRRNDPAWVKSSESVGKRDKAVPDTKPPPARKRPAEAAAPADTARTKAARARTPSVAPVAAQRISTAAPARTTATAAAAAVAAGGRDGSGAAAAAAPAAPLPQAAAALPGRVPEATLPRRVQEAISDAVLEVLDEDGGSIHDFLYLKVMSRLNRKGDKDAAKQVPAYMQQMRVSVPEPEVVPIGPGYAPGSALPQNAA